MTEQETWGAPRWGVFALLGLAAAYLIWQGADAFWDLYPDHHAWTEAFLSYAGGFVRRGLLGEILFSAAPWIDPRRLWVHLAAILYLIVALRVIALVLRRPNFPAILFLVSPLGLIFPLQDNLAFGRKDVILLLGFLLALAAINWLRRWPIAALCVVMAIFLGTGLTHETAWAYFPLAVVVLVHTSARERASGTVPVIALISSAYMLAMFALVAFNSGSPETSEKIVAAWQSIRPEIYQVRGAVGWLGSGIVAAWRDMARNFGTWDVWIGYGIAIALGLAPIFAYARRVAPLWRRDVLGRVSLVVAAFALLTPLMVAADWGRYIYMACVCVFAALASIDHAEPTKPVEQRQGLPMLLAVALVFVYSSTWSVLHWVNEDTPLRPGYLFKLMEIRHP